MRALYPADVTPTPRKKRARKYLPIDLKFLLLDSIELNDLRITGALAEALTSADGGARRPGGAARAF